MYVCIKKSESEVAEMASVSAAFKASHSMEDFKAQANATNLEDIARIYTTNWSICSQKCAYSYIEQHVCMCYRPLELSNMVKYQLVLIPSDSTPLVKVFMSNQLLDVLVGE